jgi:hypothetical protein
VDEALRRAGLPPRYWKEDALERGRTVAEAIRSNLEDARLLESHPWAVLRVLWALRGKRRLARIGEPAEKPLLAEPVGDVEPPALQDPYTPPASGQGLKRVAKTLEEALGTIGLSVALEAAASTEDAEEVVRVTGRCRALLGLLVGSMLRRRSGHVVTLDGIDPPLVLLAEPFLAGCLAGEGT